MARQNFRTQRTLNFLHDLRHETRWAIGKRVSRWFIYLWQMAAGGIHDQIGGGFHRYSVDAGMARAAF